MANIPQVALPTIQNGIVREAAVDQFLVPENTTEFALNLNFDKIGAIQLRKGMTALGDQLASNTPILGTANYRNNAGTIYRQLAKVGAAVYAYNGTNWTVVRSGLNAASKARFANFIDLTYMVNGNANESLQTYNGTTFGTSNVASLPKGDFIEQYRSRIWVADSSTDKLYYSDVVATDNTLTGGTSFLQISPQDGEKITGLKRHPDALLVFKNNHIYRVATINAIDPDPKIMRGTYSQESIVETKSGIYYHHPTGFYEFVFSGKQNEISRPIIDIVQAIPRSYYDNVSGWQEDDAVCWSVGDITLGGVSFKNIVCRYTLSTQVWTVYSTGSEIRTGGQYDNGTDIFNIVGDDAGYVLKWAIGNNDNGTAISYDLITHWEYFTSIRSTAKTISEIGVLHENAQGANLTYQLDKDRENEWRQIGTLNKSIYETFNINAQNFTRIRFRLSGHSFGSPFLFRGFEALSMITSGSLKKY
jgi:hypothetical protein